MKPALFILLLFCFTAACKKHDGSPDSGNYMLANISGKDWHAGEEFMFKQRRKAVISANGHHLLIEGIAKDGKSRIQIRLSEEGAISSGTYALNSMSKRAYYSEEGLPTYWTDSTRVVGVLTVHLSENSVSGTFSFKGMDDKTEAIVEIKKGRFCLALEREGK